MAVPTSPGLHDGACRQSSAIIAQRFNLSAFAAMGSGLGAVRQAGNEWFMLRASIFIAALAFAPAAFAQTIDGAALVIGPPALGSARDAADRLAMGAPVSAERLAQARADQDLSPWQAMAPVLGAEFTEARLPHTAAALRAARAAFGPPINAAKAAQMRERPFVADPGLARCDRPDAELAANSSFPSGHGGAGWAWGLLLAELIPSRADALLRRGRDFGESRVICGFHFPSDIEASRLIASAALARLHGEAPFRRDMEAARRELARAYPN